MVLTLKLKEGMIRRRIKDLRMWFFMPIILFPVLLNAQTGFSEWEWYYFTKNASTAQQDFVQNVVFPRDLLFPKIETSRTFSDQRGLWNIFLKKCFAGFFTESKSYGFNKSVSLVYGLLNLGNYDTYRFHMVLKKNINDTAWVEQLYTALLPVIKESWKLLDAGTMANYKIIISHVENYLKRFDFKAEDAYYRKLQKANTPEYFIIYNPGTVKRNELRKGEAFIFRRMSDSKNGVGNWSIKWGQKMVKKLKADLKIR
jgi:hypothetical protein